MAHADPIRIASDQRHTSERIIDLGAARHCRRGARAASTARQSFRLVSRARLERRFGPVTPARGSVTVGVDPPLRRGFPSLN
jgi:hypothetical protein